MSTRMTGRNVVFSHPFVLPGFERVAPAGTYLVETEEEADEGNSAAWRKLATIMHVTHDGATAYVKIDTGDLDKALARDRGAPEADDAMQARVANGRRRNAQPIRRKKF